MLTRTPGWDLGSCVQVHYVQTDRIADTDATRARYLPLLSAQERDRHQRFRFAQDRHIYLLAHALVRRSLSDELGCAPTDLQFEEGSHGKPALAPSWGAPPLHFNLSHTHGMVACGLTRVAPVGVDVERLDRRIDLESLAQRVFSDVEQADLFSRTGQAQRERFFQYWTLKEAYIKAVGLGLSLPLEQITLRVSEAEPIAIAFGPEIQDRGGPWQLVTHRPTASHMLSAAIPNAGRASGAVGLHWNDATDAL